jgi:hypothetical protein
MTDHRDYRTDDSGEDEASRLLKQILSPAEAQSLVLPPPNHAPASGPGGSTPLTGNLQRPPSQATPSRSPVDHENAPARRGLAGYFATATAPMPGRREPAALNRRGDPQYVKILSHGQVGYLPKTNLHAARQIDGDLKVLDEVQGK